MNSPETAHDPTLLQAVDFLIRRMALPQEAGPTVQRLLAAQDEGHTALGLEDTQGLCPQWGPAVADASQGMPSEPVPLVFFSKGSKAFLQSWRLFKTEHEIASRFVRLFQGRQSPESSSPLTDDSAFAPLFSGAESNPQQLQALKTALSGPFTLITGGPGTGKTFILSRILTLCEARAIKVQARSLRVALGAPTGKAADRMKESVRASLDSLQEPYRSVVASLQEAAESAGTLHSLLGFNPASGRCRFNRTHPLPVDLLIIDEASMIDVFLWRALLDALPEEARLIVMGDPNQLESVGAGNVLAELVGQAQRHPQFGNSWVHLAKSQRFKNRPGIQALAQALEKRDTDAMERLLRAPAGAPESAGLEWHGEKRLRTWDDFPDVLKNGIHRIAQASSPKEAHTALQKIRVLTSHRDYSFGAAGVNQIIEQHLFRTDSYQVGARPHKQPIIINRNDVETGLRNGSVGILGYDNDEKLRAWFPDGGKKDALAEYAPGKLPDHSPAWALTIHRSQGSEFDEIVVILPPAGSPLATRELIYTAITRAKHGVHLFGSMDSLREAILQDSKRISMLGMFIETL